MRDGVIVRQSQSAKKALHAFFPPTLTRATDATRVDKWKIMSGGVSDAAFSLARLGSSSGHSGTIYSCKGDRERHTLTSCNLRYFSDMYFCSRNNFTSVLLLFSSSACHRYSTTTVRVEKNKFPLVPKTNSFTELSCIMLTEYHGSNAIMSRRLAA